MNKYIKNLLTNTGPQILFNKKNFILKPSLQTTLGYQSFGNKNKNKFFYVISRWPTSGFFSNLTFVVGHLRICKKIGFIPIIDMKNYKTLYNEKHKIFNTYNAWEYYFEKLNNFTLKEVYQSKNVFFSSLKFNKSTPIDMNDKKVFKLIKEIKIKKNILIKYKNFKKNKFKKNEKILGVHFRGSTYKIARGHAFPATVKLMVENINQLFKKYNYEKIFLVTEEDLYAKELKKIFKDKCIIYPSYRMTTIDSFKNYPRKNHRYLLGEEILIETLLLSNCTGITYVKSNVSSAAINFSENKIKLHPLYYGTNSRNKFISAILWKIKSVIPKFLGGLKLIKK